MYVCMYVGMQVYGGEPPLCMFHSLAKRPYANWPVLTSSVQLVFIIIIMCTSVQLMYVCNLYVMVPATFYLLPSTCVCRRVLGSKVFFILGQHLGESLAHSIPLGKALAIIFKKVLPNKMASNMLFTQKHLMPQCVCTVYKYNYR